MSTQMYFFKGDGYATDTNAQNKLFKYRAAIGDATCFVAFQGGRYFPVVIYRDGAQCNVGALISQGITVLN